MRCKEIEILLVGYHDNSLDPQERKRVKEHLAECEDCSIRLKEIEDTLGLLAKESVPRPEQDFWINFLPRVRSRIETKERPRLSLFPKPGWVVGFTTIVLVVALGLVLFTMDKKSVIRLRTESVAETLLPQSDLFSYAEQLTEMLSDEDELSVDALLSNSEEEELELTEQILEEDYLSRTSLNSILSESSVEELKQIEESMKVLKIGDIL